MKRRTITRRRLLAGLGVTGFATVAGLGVGTTRARGFQQTTTIAEETGYTLEADWRVTHNGNPTGDSDPDTIVPTPEGAAISLGNVLPGDSGTFSFRLRVVPDSEDASPSIDPLISLDLTETAENGLTEPERVAGDQTADEDQGELQDFLDVALWNDVGLLGIEEWGAENAVLDLGEDSIHEDAVGSLTEVADALNEVSLTDGSCLGANDSFTVTFRWSFDTDAGPVNVTQGDGVGFDFVIVPTSC